MSGGEELQPGFMAVHGNRLEDLRAVIVEWMQAYPLRPLETETVLVQSNGMAQWLSHALAAHPDSEEPGCGIAAGLSLQLPARFTWTAYREVLGREAVPLDSPFDKRPLTWRLMRLLPQLVEQPGFEPLRGFLERDDDRRKRHQLAERLADLFDQYQVYRADWLADWAEGRDQCAGPGRAPRPLAERDRWQPRLWRALLADMDDAERGLSRAAIHARYLAALRELPTRPAGLPRRLIVFGISSLPHQVLEALEGLARFTQVLVGVHNPCQHFWADIVADKDLLRARRRRQPHKPGMPETLDDSELHNHAQPLLAAWGKQGRDYIRLLDEHDDPEHYRHLLESLSWQRIDIFQPHGKGRLLHQLQEDIRELRPLRETREHWPAVAADDTSLQFHVAHSPQREVEVLHDRLLARFNAPDKPLLRPRDVIVMVPDIDRYAPHIQAVFGQTRPGDPRHIPYTLSDQGSRGRDTVLIALERLLHLPESRCAVSELLDLLDVPALRRRFGLREGDLRQLHQWAEGAGVRWGLGPEQRAGLGLPGGLEANTWRFGLRRMLLGYAVGSGEAWQGVEPYDEVGGLDAGLLGPLEQLLTTLDAAWARLRQPQPPAEWLLTLQWLLNACFDPGTETEATTLDQLQETLEQWAADCEAAALDEPLPLNVVREHWLSSLDEGGLSQRFLAGAVNFCTLMPMRAIPFRVVCLLGMNDSDYPRSPTPLDFDLMADDYRPGDRSRREDDRYLFLEALLSAREQLYISWVGRSVRDNEPRPPSVLIGQLRDHLAAGWALAGAGHEPRPDKSPLLQQLTTEHPLQPFSRVNFPLSGAVDARHFTYAREWQGVQAAAGEHDPAEAAGPDNAALPEDEHADEPVALAPTTLARFLQRPVQAFFQHRLGVYFDEDQEGSEDLEPFELDGLTAWQLRQQLVQTGLGAVDKPEAWPQILEGEAARLRRSGTLPVGAAGELVAASLLTQAEDVLQRYHERLQAFPQVVPPIAAEQPLAHGRWQLAPELEGLRSDGHHRLQLGYNVSRLKDAKGRDWRYEKLLATWVDHLVANALAGPVTTELVGLDTGLSLQPVPDELARSHLAQVLRAWDAGQRRPLPLACRTAMAWLDAAAGGKHDPMEKALITYTGNEHTPGEAQRDPYLLRVYPQADWLLADPDFARWRDALYRPLHQAVQRHDQAGRVV